MQSVFTKKDTINMYGVAILLMLFHHLFCIPDRMGGYIPVLYFGQFNLETTIAWFAKICVAIYAFISGYGFYSISIQEHNTGFIQNIILDYKIVIRHLLKLYKKYWIVFVIFIPIGFLFYDVPFERELFMKSLLGKSADYNHEWWYMWQYIKFVILFPFARYYVNDTKNRIIEAAKMLLVLMGVLLLVLPSPVQELVHLLVYQELGFYFLIFLVGMYCVRFHVFEQIDLVTKGVYQLVTTWFMLILVIVIRVILADKANYNTADVFLTPFFVYSVTRLLSNITNSKSVKVIQLFGKYSTYIWLTHTFFAYYYFQKLVLLPKYSILIVIWLSLLMLLCGYCLDRVENLVDRVLFHATNFIPEEINEA